MIKISIWIVIATLIVGGFGFVVLRNNTQAITALSSRINKVEELEDEAEATNEGLMSFESSVSFGSRLMSLIQELDSFGFEGTETHKLEFQNEVFILFTQGIEIQISLNGLGESEKVGVSFAFLNLHSPDPDGEEVCMNREVKLVGGYQAILEVVKTFSESERGRKTSQK